MEEIVTYFEVPYRNFAERTTESHEAPHDNRPDLQQNSGPLKHKTYVTSSAATLFTPV